MGSFMEASLQVNNSISIMTIQQIFIESLLPARQVVCAEVTKMSKTPFLATRAQTISGKDRYMVVMVTQLYKLKTIELHNLDW